MDDHRVSLANLARGGAIERFDDELMRVLDNVLDPNAGDGPREVLLRVRIKPSEDKRTATVHVLASSKLAAPKAVPTMIYLGRGATGAVAFEHNPDQLKLILSKPILPAFVGGAEEE
jgi:hypothetical protein